MACIIENNGYPQLQEYSPSKLVNGYPVVFEGTDAECHEWLQKECKREVTPMVHSYGVSIRYNKDQSNGDGNTITYDMVSDCDEYHVIGYEDYDGGRSYVINDGPFKGSESFYNEWHVTSRAIDGCQMTNYCCFEGTYEECAYWIELHK